MRSNPRTSCRRQPARFHLQPRGLALALAGCGLLTLAARPAVAQVAPLPAAALPAGLAVVAGQAQVSTVGNRMTVVNTPQTILNWNSFSIGGSAAVHFQQATAASQVLNRVVGADPSQILGSLSSNGRVWLLNPNGVLFGANARVDVAGLVASTLRLNDNDWLAGRWRFTDPADGSTAASVVNQGELRSSFGGSVALVGGSVDNGGLVQAPGGQIVLAAGHSVELVDTGAPNLAVKVSAPAGEARNLGQLQAAGGRIDIHAASVNQQGIVSADTLTAGPGGEVWIKASQAVELGAASRTSADGASGGSVHVESDAGRSSLRGVVSAQGSDGAGGQAVLLGREVGLFDAARVDVSGARGGGEALVGGGERGQDARYANARAVYFGADATIAADARAQGDGGRIVLWSDQATRAFGSLSVRGGDAGAAPAGAAGGAPFTADGGFIETSGGWLDARPAKVDTGARQGLAGHWLLDPYNIQISDTLPTLSVDASFTAVGSPASIGTSTINAALNAGTSVTVSTGGTNGSSEAGNITLTNANIAATAAAPGNLSLIADGNLTMSQSTIRSGGAPMAVSLLAGRGGSGSVALTSSTISTARTNPNAPADPAGSSRDITIGGFGSGTTPSGGSFGGSAASVRLTSSTLTAGIGQVTLSGAGSTAGVVLVQSAVSGRDVALRGSSAGDSGVVVQGASTVDATHHIELLGVGVGAGVVVQEGSALRVKPSTIDSSADLLIQGRGVAGSASSSSGNNGVAIDGGSTSAGTLIASNGASISVTAANPLNDPLPALTIRGTAGVPTIDSSAAGGDVVLGVFDSGRDVLLNRATLAIGGALRVQSVDELALTNGSTVDAAGTVTLFGTDQSLDSGTRIASDAAGDAILLAGSATSPLQDFSNAAGSAALAAPNGRWIVLAQSPDPAVFSAGGLAYDFKRYNVNSRGYAADAGNGLVFVDPQTANFTATIASRVYDGTTAAPLSSASASGIQGERGLLRSGATASYADRNVGSGKSASFDIDPAAPLEPLVFTDSNGKPVYGYTLAGALTGTVTRATVSAAINVADKVYDAGTAAQIAIGAVSGLVGSETLAISASGRFADKNVGTAKDVTPTYTVANGSNGGLAGNYQFVTPITLTASITARPIGISGLTVNPKVYDRTTAATGNGTATVTPLGGDNLTLAGTLAFSFLDRNAGTAKPVATSGVQLAGSDAGNYTLLANALTGDITPRPLAIGGVGVLDKTYDATTTAALSGSPTAAVIQGDQVTVGGSASARFTDKNVGSAKPVTVTGYTLGGTDAGNYAVVQPTGLAGNILPLAVVLRGITANDKVYDASTAATLSGAAGVATLAGDAVTLSGTGNGRFNDKNVGTNKSVSIGGYALAGADAGNYNLLVPTLLAAITPRPLAVNGLAAANKVYDGTASATLTGSAGVAALAGDAVVLAGGAPARFADKNVGTAKPVSVTGYTLSGADAANYSLTQPAGLVADITPLALSIAGLSTANKVYDGGTTATLSGSGNVTALSGDAVTLVGSTASANFADKNVGTAKPVSVTGYGLTGADAVNYRLAQPAGLVADITPLALSIAGLSAANKVYDGGTTATLSGSGNVTALSGDAVTLVGSAATANFADKNVGSAKPVSVTGYGLTGADAANYRLAQPAGLVADITPLALSIAGLSAANKVYDGGITATLSGSGNVTALSGDAVTLVGSAASANFADKNVGSTKPVSVTGYGLAGADAANYRLAQPAGLVADITPLTLSITGVSAANKVYDGGIAATLSGSGSGSVAVLSGDAVTLVGSTASASFADKNVGTAKPVSVTGYALSGADSANYRLSQPAGLAAAITPRPLALTDLAAADKVYDAGTTATVTGGRVSPLAGDAVVLTGSPQARFADANVGSAKLVSVDGYALAGADAVNYGFSGSGSTSASITPATLAYLATPAVRNVGEPLTGFGGSVTGFVGGETATTGASGALTFGTPAAPGAPPGSYPLVGDGLNARNYRFVQAPGNATALSVIDVTPTLAVVVIADQRRADDPVNRVVALATGSAARADGGIALALAVAPVNVRLDTASTLQPVDDFGAVRLSSLSTRAVQQLLDGRALYKQALLADAVSRLQRDPGLAALQECQSLAEAERGTCLVSAELKARLGGQPAASAAAGGGSSTADGPAGTPGSAATPTAPPAGNAPAAPADAATIAPREPAVPLPAVTPSTASPTDRTASPAPDPATADAPLARRTVRSAALPQIDRKIALLIGIDRYADPTIPALNNAVRDAHAVGRVFESRLGYEVVNLDNATRPALVAALNRLALTLGPRDSVVVYYAGHGELVESTGVGYWLLADSNAKQPETWLSNADISRLIGQLGALQVALVSDSCYSGSLAAEERIRAAPAALDPKSVLQRKSVVVMSSGGNEPVFDDGKDGHSPFAWNLMNTLGQVANWQAGSNVFERVRFAVARTLPQRPQYSASRAAGHQSGGDYLFEQRQLDSGRANP